jgi:hypothetical protein
MLIYIAGLAAVGLVGSFVFQGHPESRIAKRLEGCRSPDIRDYQVPDVVEEEPDFAHR